MDLTVFLFFFIYKCFHSKIKVMLPVFFFYVFIYLFIYSYIWRANPNLILPHIYFFVCVLSTFYKWSKIESLQVRRNSIVQTNLDRQSEWVIYFLLPTITIQLHYQRCIFFRSCITNPPKGAHASEWLWCF